MNELEDYLANNVNDTIDTKITGNFFMALFKFNHNDIDNLVKSLKQDDDYSVYGIRPNKTNFSNSNKNSLLYQVLKIIDQKEKCLNTRPTSRISTLDVATSNNMIPYGELCLILIVLTLWLLSILLCLSKYQKLRTIPPMLPPYSNEPMHIEEVKIVKNEQDTIIYRKKPSTFQRYATLKNSNLDSPNFESQIYNITNSNRKSFRKSKIRSYSEPRLSVYINSDSVHQPYWSYSRECNKRVKLKQLQPSHVMSLSNNPTQTEIVRKKFLNMTKSYSPNKLLWQYSKNLNKRVSDKRNLYARSKNSIRRPLSEVKRYENTWSLKSCDQSIEDNTTVNSQKNEIDSFDTIDQNRNILEEIQETSFIRSKPKSIKLTRNTHTFSGNTPTKSPGLLDPNWIPLKVQESLLNLHYALHKKPTLLQTSHISKSDSNLKTRNTCNVMDQFTKKLLSLQNSQEKKHSCLL
ncbi:unnamed protein product [Brachionus calyciflorus]|uniref:Uncharacterized protein n=1 Tax=Brachionus calyciflorus TaxID=104777 RepID=A0A813MA45_9BILA|nr:unnamed protein product [Brachionus calyciflorus]